MPSSLREVFMGAARPLVGTFQVIVLCAVISGCGGAEDVDVLAQYRGPYPENPVLVPAAELEALTRSYNAWGNGNGGTVVHFLDFGPTPAQNALVCFMYADAEEDDCPPAVGMTRLELDVPDGYRAFLFSGNGEPFAWDLELGKALIESDWQIR